MHNDNDPAYALIFEHVSHFELTVRIGAVIGLGLAYAGTCRSEVEELLLPLIVDPDTNVELAGFAALSLGLVFSSACRQECVEAITAVRTITVFPIKIADVQALMVRSQNHLTTPYTKMLCLGLGMLFLGKEERVEATVEVNFNGRAMTFI